MRIISLNAWGGALWPALCEWLPIAGADVLLLQEMIRAPVPSPVWLEYRDPYRTLAQRADLFGDVRRLLPDWQAVFAPAARGYLSAADGREVLSEHGLAAFFAPHLCVTAHATAFAHGRFRADGWGPEPVPRAMQLFRLEGAVGLTALTVAHLHGLRDPSGKGDTEARAAQAAAISAALTEFRAPDEPMILAGDLNLLPDSATFPRLAELGLRDLVTDRGFTDTRTSHYAKAQRYADYLLVTPNVPVAGFDVPARPEVSDHRPLVLDLVPTAP